MSRDQPAEPADALPERVGRFRVVREAGRGGMGRVYEALDEPLRRTVAVKVLYSTHPTLTERFLREARTAASLDHANIVRVLEVGEEAGRPFLVMEWIDGTDLRVAIESGRLSPREAVGALAQAAEALAHAHARGVVHRDLKPENILVTPAKRAIITDFGIALDLSSEEPRLTQSGVFLGTPGFMSPEQVLGRRSEVDARSDVWGVGATLYWVLTGSAPFTGLTLHDVYEKVLKADPTPPQRLDPSVNRDLQTICLKALSKEKSRRYATAREMAADLKRSLAGEPILARPPGPAYRACRWIGRRWKIGAGSAVLGLLVAAVWLGVGRLQRSRDFRSACDYARRAYAAGEWARARIEAERALGLREDSEMRGIAEDCRARLSFESDRTELRTRLAQIEARLRDARHFFYLRAADPPKEIGRLEALRAELETLVAVPRFAPHSDGWRCLGIVRYVIGDVRGAEEALLRAESHDRDDVEVAYFLGRIHLERGMAELLPDESGIHSSRRIRAGDESARAVSRLRGPLGDLAPMHRHLAETYVALADGKVEEVLRRCEAGLAAYGAEMGSEEYWILRAWVQPGDYRDCTARALDARPHYPWAYVLRATLRPSAESAEAIADCTEALRINPRFAAAFVARAHLRYHRRELQESQEDCTAAIALEPEFGHAYRDRSAIRIRIGNAAGALEDAEQAVRLEPDSPDAYFSRGVARVARGDWDAAIADYTQSLDLEPLRADAFVNRGIARFRKGDRAGARGDYETAIRIDPSYAPAHYNRGYLRMMGGENEGAFADYSESLRLNPGHAESWNNRGWLRWKARKDLPGALLDFEEALRRDSTLAEAYVNRGEVRLQTGNRAGAAEDLRRGLDLLPRDHPARERLERTLRSLAD